MAASCFKKRMVREHLETVGVLHLKASPAFHAASVEAVCAAYNGIGPDRLPWWGRGIITLGARIFAPAALIHDFDYEEIIADYAGLLMDEPPTAEMDAWTQEMIQSEMRLANLRFLENCQKIVRLRCGILNPLRYLWLGIARLFFILCERYGLRGILDGIRVRVKLRTEAKALTAQTFGGR